MPSEQELYRRIKVLGVGSQGKAYLVECLGDGQKYVTKQMDMKFMTDEEKKECLKEAKVLMSLRHANIITFKEVYKTKKGKLCIVMDYADGGDLQQKIKGSKQGFSEAQILDWLTQISLALKHIHDKKIIHRDIKSQNILLTKDNRIKLADFGIARILSYTQENVKTMIGTPYYLAPEIIENQPYSQKADIWSLGVVLYELCALKQPFEANSLPQLALKIIKGQFSPIPQGYSKELKALVNSLLTVDTTKRPSVSQILKMPIITERAKNFLSETIDFMQTMMIRNLEVKDLPTIDDEKKSDEQQQQYQDQSKENFNNNRNQEKEKDKEKEKDNDNDKKGMKRYFSPQHDVKKPTTKQENRNDMAGAQKKVTNELPNIEDRPQSQAISNNINNNNKPQIINNVQNNSQNKVKYGRVSSPDDIKKIRGNSPIFNAKEQLKKNNLQQQHPQLAKQDQLNNNNNSNNNSNSIKSQQQQQQQPQSPNTQPGNQLKNQNQNRVSSPNTKLPSIQNNKIKNQQQQQQIQQQQQLPQKPFQPQPAQQQHSNQPHSIAERPLLTRQEQRPKNPLIAEKNFFGNGNSPVNQINQNVINNKRVILEKLDKIPQLEQQQQQQANQQQSQQQQQAQPVQNNNVNQQHQQQPVQQQQQNQHQQQQNKIIEKVESQKRIQQQKVEINSPKSKIGPQKKIIVPASQKSISEFAQVLHQSQMPPHGNSNNLKEFKQMQQNGQIQKQQSQLKMPVNTADAPPKKQSSSLDPYKGGSSSSINANNNNSISTNKLEQSPQHHHLQSQDSINSNQLGNSNNSIINNNSNSNNSQVVLTCKNSIEENGSPNQIQKFAEELIQSNSSSGSGGNLNFQHASLQQQQSGNSNNNNNNSNGSTKEKQFIIKPKKPEEMKKCASSELIINRNKSNDKLLIQAQSVEEQKDSESQVFKKSDGAINQHLKKSVIATEETKIANQQHSHQQNSNSLALMQEETEYIKKLCKKEEKESKLERKIIFHNVFDELENKDKKKSSSNQMNSHNNLEQEIVPKVRESEDDLIQILQELQGIVDGDNIQHQQQMEAPVQNQPQEILDIPSTYIDDFEVEDREDDSDEGSHLSTNVNSENKSQKLTTAALSTAESDNSASSDIRKSLQDMLEKEIGSQNIAKAYSLAKKILEQEKFVYNNQELQNKYKGQFSFLNKVQIEKYLALFFTLVIMENGESNKIK